MAGTVLIVEDDPEVLVFIEIGLEWQGFQVVSARSAGEALNILGSGFPPITTLVCDIRLGAGLDGWEIARCAREITPNLPIVYVTGDSAGSWGEEGVPNSRLLEKPFTSDILVDAIKGLLAESA